MLVQLELTEGCNHRCFHCYNSFARSSKSMGANQISRVMDQLTENKVFSVVLTGGEPLVNRKGVYFALERGRSLPMDFFLNTNLSLNLGAEDLSMLGLTKFVLVSFLSYSEERFNDIVGANSYRKVLNNLEKLTSEGIHFGVNQVVSSKNRQDVYKTGQFLFERFGLRSFSASPMVPVREEDAIYQLSPEEVVSLGRDLIRLEKDYGIRADMLECVPPCVFPSDMREHVIAHHGCSAGKDFVSVSTSGLVKRCPKLNESYGNIFEEDLKEIWSRMDGHRKLLNSLCNGCSAAEGCYAGCEARAALGKGVDLLVKGATSPYRDVHCAQMLPGRIYRMQQIRWRPEGEELLIAGVEDGFVFGNDMLRQFITRLQGGNFTLAEGVERFGDDAPILLNYLYQRRIVRDAV